jgi:hypothetical protein
MMKKSQEEGGQSRRECMRRHLLMVYFLQYKPKKKKIESEIPQLVAKRWRKVLRPIHGSIMKW